MRMRTLSLRAGAGSRLAQRRDPVRQRWVDLKRVPVVFHRFAALVRLVIYQPAIKERQGVVVIDFGGPIESFQRFRPPLRRAIYLADLGIDMGGRGEGRGL